MLARVPVLFACLLLACSRSEEREVEAPSDSTSPVAEALRAGAEARGADSRPSVLLVVIDTLRADAVSSYGEVEGTTPVLDGLAAQGLRYERSFAPAPFTASSHASLFTGLRVDEHGVGLSQPPLAAPSLQVLAEDFQDAGYATAGFSENSLLGPEFGFDQGFDRYEVADLLEVVKTDMRGEDSADVLGTLARVRRFLRERDPSQPYFIFVNLIDPHDPYIVRTENPWLPEGTDRVRAETVKASYRIPMSLCYRVPPTEDREILRGLYLGDVAAADRKLGRLLALLDSVAPGEPRLTVVTSDHGEHFGEHRLMGHRFSVRHPVLRIPLVVAGLPETPPAVIATPVEMRHLYGSLLCWALGRSCPAALPVEPGAAPETESAPIFSIWSDEVATTPKIHRERLGFGDGEWKPDWSRDACRPDDRVFGDMVSMIRYPMKATWVEGQGIELHDLSWDPDERSDQREVQAAVAEPLARELEAFVEERIVGRDRTPEGELDLETTRALKSLGYIE